MGEPQSFLACLFLSHFHKCRFAQLCTLHPAQGQSFIINLFQSNPPSFSWLTILIFKVSEDGARITGAGGLLAIFPLVWIPEGEAEKLQRRPYDRILAPIVPYPMQPAKQGRLVREFFLQNGIDEKNFLFAEPYCLLFVNHICEVKIKIGEFEFS